MDYNNFQDNIPADTFDFTSNNILNWIQENRDKIDRAKDPNSYEMVNLFLFGAKYIEYGKDINITTLRKIWEIRSKDFDGCNISNNNFVYGICEDAYKSALMGVPLVNDENSHHALRKMAGLGLFLKIEQRDTGVVEYNNPPELLQLLQASQGLKTLHPDLFSRYQFSENIKVLCELQLRNKLPDSVSKSIIDARDKVLGNNSKEKNVQETDSDAVEL